MKRIGYLYENIYKMENIERCFHEVCTNTKNITKRTKFKEYKCIYITKVYNTLKNQQYVVGKPSVFYIKEPKLRRIVSQNMYDKIVNHLVSRYILYPAIFPCLVDENCSSVPNKGRSYALNLFYKAYRNMKNKYDIFYILKCDVKSYFGSINHDRLKEKVKRRIKDKLALKIVFDIIDSDEVGLSIGFMSSQILGIFYLNDLDHFIKEKLGIKYYVRYQDDFLLFHENKDYLKYCQKEINVFLESEMLKLNPKSRIFKNTNNFIYLGCNRYGIYSNYRNVGRKMKRRKYLYEKGDIPLRSYVASHMCYKHL